MEIINYSKYSFVKIARIPINEIEKVDFARAAQPSETLANFYKRQNRKPELVMNAGFFNMNNGAPVFNYVDEKITYSSANAYRWGMGVTMDGKLKYGCLDEGGWRDFISGYPNLIDNGTIVKIDYAKEINYSARRTMLGYNDECVYAVWVENPGLKLEECAILMKDIGCKYAINLDGGGSTKALYNGVSITKDATNRAVDNVFAVYLGTSSSKSLCPNGRVRVNGEWIEGLAGDGPIAGFQLDNYTYRAHILGGNWLPWVNGDSDYAGICYKSCFKGRFKVTSPRGYRVLNGVREYHKGIDMVGLDDTTVYSVSWGTVRVGYQANGAGNYVVVAQEDGYNVYYMHLSKVLVSNGQQVKTGDKLGIMGATGNVTGPHTHLELRNTAGASTSFPGVPNKVGIYEDKKIDAIQIKNAVYRVDDLPWVDGTNDYAGIYGKTFSKIEIK